MKIVFSCHKHLTDPLYLFKSHHLHVSLVGSQGFYYTVIDKAYI